MFSEDDVEQLCKLFTNDHISFDLLGVSHNLVYKVTSTTPFILRITPSTHRTKDEISSEIDF